MPGAEVLSGRFPCRPRTSARDSRCSFVMHTGGFWRCSLTSCQPQVMVLTRSRKGSASGENAGAAGLEEDDPMPASVRLR